MSEVLFFVIYFSLILFFINGHNILYRLARQRKDNMYSILFIAITLVAITLPVALYETFLKDYQKLQELSCPNDSITGTDYFGNLVCL